ncbi:LysR family transcriptional regulator [Weissella koreensis]|uniref:LysR family transcriptional regulator n=1 Tax=Weissella koreensis TaxID=165096 RepID=UPI0022BA3D7C|nr:LysR family transcriptional regulator [Weissella koreensis]MCZ9310799.1 LysR family transcriptional regulator [Weissella koreensis]
MNIKTLEYFVQVATEENLTKASEKLFISQPTLSRHMKELENDVQRKLFVRKSHSLKLSQDGILFLREATKVLQSVSRLEHLFDLDEATDNKVEYIKIGYLENFNMSKMYDLLESYKKIFKNTQFILSTDSPVALNNGLNSGMYDMIFSLYPYIKANANFKSKKFIENHLQIALPLNHPLGKNKDLSFSDLKDETFILLDRDKSPIIVDYVLNKGTENGFNLKANYYVKNLSQGLSMTALGNGLAFLYSAMDQTNLEEKFRINIVNLDDTKESQDIHMAINNTNINSMKVDTIYNFNFE